MELHDDAPVEMLSRFDIADDLQLIKEYLDWIDFENVVATSKGSIYTFGLIINS